MNTREWGTLTKQEAAILRELLDRFIAVCPDADNHTDPADLKRIRAAERILKP